MHSSITIDRVTEVVEDGFSNLDSAGFCLACGEDAYGVEPDARNYTCEVCDEPRVFGAEEVLVMIA